MNKYFRGSIINVNDIKPITYNLDIVDEHKNDYTNRIHFYIDDIIKNGDNKIIKLYVDHTLSNLLNPKLINPKIDMIIYYRLSDNKGNYFGKEIISGLVFPIKVDNEPYDIIYSNGDVKEIYYDVTSNVVYSINEDIKNDHYCLINGILKREYALPKELINEIQNIKVGSSKKVNMYGSSHTIKCITPSNYIIEFKPNNKVIDNKNITYAITNEMEANTFEVSSYFDRFDNVMFKKWKKLAYYKMLRNLSLNNDISNLLNPYQEEEKKLIKKR